MKQSFLLAGILATSLGVSGCGGGGSRPVASAQSAGETVQLSTNSGRLSPGKNDLTVAITDASGPVASVTSPQIRFFMPAMGQMGAMNAETSLQPAGQPGTFTGRVDIPMEGTWQTTVSYQDAAGPHRVSFNLRSSR